MAKREPLKLEPKKSARENLSVSLPPDVVRRLREFAEKRDATQSSVVALALDTYLAGQAA